MSEYIIDWDENLVIDTFSKNSLRGKIVRCNSCKYYDERTYNWLNGWVRTSTTCFMFDGCHVEPNGFCSWGERRGE